MRIATAAALALLFGSTAHAGEPKRSVLLENDTLRVAEVVFAPGDSEVEHTHARPMLVYFVTAGTLENVAADGTLQTLAGKVGDFSFIPAGTTHRARNTSKDTVVVRAVALK